VPDDEPRPWLDRFGYADWMSAALHELEHAYHALRGKQRRKGITHARRAAGMAVNARLAVDFDARYGRTYAQHVMVLAEDERVPEAVRAAAARLLAAKEQRELVTIGPGAVDVADDAKLIIAWLADQLPPP
jgi:HEPN domain-containing protein